MLMIVISYDLVNYLLHYSSARCVTFKELFVCKSNNKTGDFDINLPDFFFSHKFFRKSNFIRWHTISQKDFEQTHANYRISGEKGFASRLRRTETFQTDDAKFISFAQMSKGCFYGFSDDFSFSLSI